MAPPCPTTVQVLASLQETAYSAGLALLGCWVHVAPPSVVRRMAPTVKVPPPSTAVHVLALGQDTASAKPLDCVHVAPPSVVYRLPCPTAAQVLASAQETPKSPFDPPDCSVHVAPPSVVRKMISGG